MKHRRHIALLIVLLLLPGIVGNVTLHACWVPAMDDCCEIETDACCDTGPSSCEVPDCGTCDAVVPVQGDNCECSTCHVTLPGADMVATFPVTKKADLDEAPLAVLTELPALALAGVERIRTADDPSPPVHPGVPTTVLLI